MTRALGFRGMPGGSPAYAHAAVAKKFAPWGVPMAKGGDPTGIPGRADWPGMEQRAAATTMNPDARHQLQETDWHDVGIRLTGYAAWKARNRWWRSGRLDTLAGGRTSEDVAHDAIRKVLAGERAWDPRRGALLPFLQGVVDSLLSHLADSFDNRVVHLGGSDADPVPVESDADPRERIATLRAALRAEGDDRLLAVVDAILQGCEPKPQAVAQHLQITVADVNNRLKRLRRLALKSLYHRHARPAGSAR